MKFLNKVFNGDQSEKTSLSDPLVADLPVHKEDLNLTPLDQLAGGEPADTVVPFANTMTVEEEVKLPDLAQELAYLDKYERLQNKMNVSELYGIFNTLESISHSLTDANQSKAKPDDVLETWKPLLAHIEAFTVKKKLLQSIEAQMNQTIDELREIHQKMFDSISQVRTYNSEREAMYAVRRQLADELEKKLRLIQNLG
jgi:DNA repair ATPase RecN